MTSRCSEFLVHVAIGVATSVCLMVGLGGCTQGREEITFTKPYADFIGREYRVITDDLHAYGVYDSLDSKKLIEITLIPGVGIGGPEIAFRKPVPKGQVIRILSAWQKSMLFERRIYYLVSVPNSELPQGVPIQVELFLGNKGVGADLNSSAYKRILQPTD
jgi:hypothetical protein